MEWHLDLGAIPENENKMYIEETQTGRMEEVSNNLFDALNNLGIRIMDNSGNYRCYFDVFDELSNKWHSLSR